jgi:transposase
MVRNREIVKRVTQMVIDKNISPREAAELLEADVRTVHNCSKRYALHGAVGLIDHRHGTYRKLTAEMEQQIIECKRQKPQRSARWIRSWLKLNVSVECVRRILVKHHLTGEGTNGQTRREPGYLSKQSKKSRERRNSS